jgi:hypothetical protein
MKFEGKGEDPVLFFEIETAILQITPPKLKITRSSTLMHTTTHRQPMRMIVPSLPFK